MITYGVFKNSIAENGGRDDMPVVYAKWCSNAQEMLFFGTHITIGVVNGVESIVIIDDELIED